MSLLTVEQLLEREPALGSRARVWEMVRRGLLPSVRAGRRILIESEQIEAWKRSGGKCFAGGWRREQQEAGA